LVIDCSSQTEHALGVAVEDRVHDLVGEAEVGPLPQDPLVRHARVVAAEHDLVAQPAADVGTQLRREVLRRPARHLPEHVALVQGHGGHDVDPRPAGVRGDDRQVGEGRGEPVDRDRVGVLDQRAHPAGHPGAHAGGADVDHHRHTEARDRLEQRAQRRVVDAEVPHDRVEVEPDDAVDLHGLLGVADRLLALERVDRAPRRDELVGVVVAQLRDVGVAARRRPGHRLDVEGDEHRLEPVGLQVRDDVGLLLGHPGLLPVRRQGLDVGALRGDPRRGAGVAVQIDLSHPVLLVTYRCR
jgi:hypothetical protein